MNLSRTVLLIVAGPALLTACGKSGGGTQTATAASNAAAPAAPAAPTSGPDTAITEADLPHPKLGMWEVTTTANGRQDPVEHNCMKQAQHISLKDLAQVRRYCPGFTYKRTFLGDYVIDADCNTGQMRGVTHMVVHGDFTGGDYTTDSSATFSFAGRPPMTFTRHTVSHWIGPC